VKEIWIPIASTLSYSSGKRPSDVTFRFREQLSSTSCRHRAELYLPASCIVALVTVYFSQSPSRFRRVYFQFELPYMLCYLYALLISSDKRTKTQRANCNKCASLADAHRV